MDVKDVERVGLIGAGVIGSGWAARLMMNGIDVAIFDPDPDLDRKVREVLGNARRAYGSLTTSSLQHVGSFTVVDSPEAACEGANFVQESLPERLELKRATLSRVSAAADSEVVIGSSTSGLRPSDLQRDCPNAHRIVVGHPFNPVYLMPLVEVCAGNETSKETTQSAIDFYRSIGMHPLLVRKEVDAFIADRLMEALWREALHMINEDVATADEIDQAICYGPGLRWAFMGSFLTYRLGGGEAGMRHFLAQFAPTLELPWTKLEAPEWTEELLDKIADQSDEQAGERSVRELERLRDDCLVSVLQGLRENDYAAGAVLNRYDESLKKRHGD